MAEEPVEFQGWGEIKPGRGAEIVRILDQRNGIVTAALLSNGNSIEIYDCGWGRDYGEDWEHMIVNVSPPAEEREVHLISTSEISRLTDPSTGDVLYDRSNGTS